MGGWSSLLMGIANRAAEVNRQQEQRSYDEGLASKHLQSQLLINKLGDINSTDEERRAAGQAFESLHKIKPGTLTDTIFPAARQVYDRFSPMIPPTEPTGPTGIGARTGQPMMTLGQLPTPPKHTQIPLSNREAERRAQTAQYEAEDRIDAAVRSGVLTPEQARIEKQGLITNKGALSLMGLATKEDIAKANLQMKQFQMMINANAAYGPPKVFINKLGQRKLVHSTKAGLNLTPRTDSEGNMVMGENNLPVMEQFNPGTDWQEAEKGIVTATDDSGNVTSQSKGNLQQSSMGGTPPPATRVEGMKGKRQYPPAALEKPMRIDYVDPDTNKVVTWVATPKEINEAKNKQQAEDKSKGVSPSPGLRVEKPPTTYERGNAGQGNIIISQAEKLKKRIPEVFSKLGPTIGRISNIQVGIGNAEPQIRGLYTDLKSFAALQPKLHGARGLQYQREFEDAVGRLSSNPQALIESINRLEDLANEFVKQGAGGKPSITGLGEPPAPQNRKVGDRKTFANGNVGEWDGTHWVQVVEGKK